jgi:4-hydroxy-tetrahydrodipicolinate synthase
MEAAMTRLLAEQTKGVYAIAATPFDESGKVDYESIDHLVDFYSSAQVSGITVLGMMGEANKLSEEESDLVLKRFINRAGSSTPVVVGVSNSSTNLLLRTAKTSMDAGAAGVMIAPPPTLRHEEQIFTYFSEVCSGLGSSTPVVLQDYPLSTGVYFSVDTINRIIDTFSQVVMLKHEDWPGLNKLTRIRNGSSIGKHRHISILVGNGGLYLPQELGRGADGAMTGFAYPEMLVKVVEMFPTAPEGAEDLFDMYLPLVRYESQLSLGMALRKEILRRRGAIRSAFVRSPGPKLTREDHEELTHLMSRLDRRLVERGQPLAKIA